MRTVTAVSSTEKLKFAVKYPLYVSRNSLRVHTKSPLILWVCKQDRLVKRFNHPSFVSEIFSDGPPHATFFNSSSLLKAGMYYEQIASPITLHLRPGFTPYAGNIFDKNNYIILRLNL